MDDTEDDARYPLNPYPQTNRRPFPSPPNYPYTNNYPNQDSSPNNPDEEVEDEDNDSSESRGKRRRLDLYARGFALVPRPLPSPSPPSTHQRSRTPSAEWSEHSTFALLDAWGDRYLQNGRRSLRSDEWAQVARKVSEGWKGTRSEAQCRNRLDTLKKKYKKEKAKHSEFGGARSKWVYFEKMDELMLLSPAPPLVPAPAPPLRIPCGIDAGEYVFAGSRAFADRLGGVSEMRDSPGDTASEGEDDESDGLPPMRGEKVGGTSEESSLKMLADSIQKFGAIYEKVEMSRRQRVEEIGRMRKEFYRDLEVHKRQILDRARAEIDRMGQEDEDEEGSDEDGNGDDEDNDIIRG